MDTQKQREGVVYLEKFALRKDKRREAAVDGTPDSLSAWAGRYLEWAVVGVRSRTVAEKAALHLGRFVRFFEEAYGRDRISTLVRRDVQGWQRSLAERDLAPSTVNNHLASLSAFTTWVDAQEPGLFPAGDPAKVLMAGAAAANKVPYEPFGGRLNGGTAPGGPSPLHPGLRALKTACIAPTGRRDPEPRRRE